VFSPHSRCSLWYIGKEDDGKGGNPFLAAGETHLLSSLAFDRDISSIGLERGSEFLFDGGNKRSDLRRLADERSIQVDDAQALSADHLPDLSEQGQAGSIFVPGVGVWKDRADIRKSGRTQQGIGNGMAQDVSVRMSEQALLSRYLDTAQHQAPARSEAMGIKAESDTHGQL